MNNERLQFMKAPFNGMSQRKIIDNDKEKTKQKRENERRNIFETFNVARALL